MQIIVLLEFGNNNTLVATNEKCSYNKMKLKDKACVQDRHSCRQVHRHCKSLVAALQHQHSDVHLYWGLLHSHASTGML